MKFNLFFVLGYGLIVMITTVFIFKTGETLFCEPISWLYPVIVFSVLVSIFLLGAMSEIFKGE